MTAVTTNMPKRVSFGNTYTSLVETLVEDDDTSTDERRFYRETFMTSSTTAASTSHDDCDDEHSTENKSLLSNYQSSQNSSHNSCSLEETPVSEEPSEPHDGVEGHADPETPLEGSAVTPPKDLGGPSIPSQQTRITPIIRLQRSPSTESHENPFTADGELSKKAEYIIRHSTISRSEIRISDPDLHKAKVKEELARTEVVPTNNAAPAPPSKDRENGKVEVSPKDVEVEVAAANASQPQPQQAEQVKVKGSKCKCCVVM